MKKRRCEKRAVRIRFHEDWPRMDRLALLVELEHVFYPIRHLFKEEQTVPFDAKGLLVKFITNREQLNPVTYLTDSLKHGYMYLFLRVRAKLSIRVAARICFGRIACGAGNQVRLLRNYWPPTEEEKEKERKECNE